MLRIDPFDIVQSQAQEAMQSQSQETMQSQAQETMQSQAQETIQAHAIVIRLSNNIVGTIPSSAFDEEDEEDEEKKNDWYTASCKYENEKTMLDALIVDIDEIYTKNLNVRDVQQFIELFSGSWKNFSTNLILFDDTKRFSTVSIQCCLAFAGFICKTDFDRSVFDMKHTLTLEVSRRRQIKIKTRQFENEEQKKRRLLKQKRTEQANAKREKKRLDLAYGKRPIIGHHITERFVGWGYEFAYGEYWEGDPITEVTKVPILGKRPKQNFWYDDDDEYDDELY
uniref:Uncharacterized protein n=1 Tax=Mimivirus LCMiAC01 TaxID=2506608 RepID=A0A481YZM6_9VIRU|nr:MAG: hypothetical protein LCMiAC01_01370 [Mimivirus LCMiAC01]